MEIGTKIYRKNPKLRPIIALIYNKFLLKPTFVGSGITTYAYLPWNGEQGDLIFNNTFENLKKLSLNMNEKIYSHLDQGKWKLWIMAFATRSALTFAKSEKYIFVECGVAEGLSSFVSLKEIKSNLKTRENYVFHLYDSWDTIRETQLEESELSSKGKYSTLDVNIVKKNLSEFMENLVFHQGYIPEIFSTSPESPESICYIHIDLNVAKPTLDALEFFYPKLVEGGVILFDDYGIGHPDTKKTIDKFLENKDGVFLKEPTGQAIFFKK